MDFTYLRLSAVGIVGIVAIVVIVLLVLSTRQTPGKSSTRGIGTIGLLLLAAVVIVGLVLPVRTYRDSATVEMQADRNGTVRVEYEASRKAPQPREPMSTSRAKSDARDTTREQTSEQARTELYPPPRGLVSETGPRGERPSSLELVDDYSDWTGLTQELQLRPEGATETPGWVTNAGDAKLVHWSSADTDFVYWEPSDTGTLASFSRVSPTVQEAHDDALRLAREKVAALAVLRLENSNSEYDAPSILPLAYELLEELDRRGDPVLKIRDEYFESTTRKYGDLYRAAILAEAKPEAVDQLTATLEQRVQSGWLEDQRQLEGILWTGASVLVLAFAIFLLYTFLNAGTKGHFAIPLRVLSVAIFFLLCATVFYVRARMGESGREPGARGVRTAETVHGKRTARDERRPVSDRRDPSGIVDRVQTARRSVRRTPSCVRESTDDQLGARPGRRGARDVSLARAGHR